MKTFILIAILLTTTTLFAEDITTLSGTKYKNVSVTRVEPNGISISHDDGLAKIPFTDLSEELRTKYGYDPKKEALFSQDEQAMAAQKAAAANAAAIQQRDAAAQANVPKYRVVMIVDRKIKGGLLLKIVSGDVSLESNAKIKESLRRISAYWDGISPNQRHDAEGPHDGRFVLRGHPKQEELVDGDVVACLSVADGVASVGGSTYKAFRWVPLP